MKHNAAVTDNAHKCMNEVIYLHAHITQCILAITVLYVYNAASVFCHVIQVEVNLHTI